MQAHILAFSGSSRRGSLNQKLLDRAVAGVLDAGGRVTQIHLLDFDLPLYDSDREAAHGVPEPARELQALIERHHGLLIATPEHNGGYTALLKNALDWVSRAKGAGLPGYSPLGGKIAALLSASPGALGGIRSQLSLQVALHKMGAQVIPQNFALGAAHQAFEEQGGLTGARVDMAVRKVGEALVQAALQSVGERKLSPA
jgi:chromate reductase, NAD(P)H dehydrogenase (quinone)